MGNKRMIIGAVAGLAGATFMVTGTVAAEQPECNWGKLTAYAIHELDFDQGGHSADPSGDGNGPEDRVGLPNVITKGDLDATCDLIADLLGVDPADL